jgi:hypothetical protein
MNKFLKVSLLILSSLFALVVVAVVVFFLGLPSPAEIGRHLTKNSKPVVAASVPVVASTAQDISASSVTPGSVAAAQETPAETKEGNLNVENTQDLEALNNLMDPRQPKSQICSHLIHANLIPDDFQYTKETFGENFKAVLLDEQQAKDPALIELLAPIRHFLQQPKMRQLVEQIVMAAQSGQASSLVEKAGFYASLYGVYQEMLEQKPAAERLMDRGYHLMMLARAVKKNPSLVSDSGLRDYCERTEQALNSGDEMNWSAEQTEFQNLLAALHVDPQDIGYNPKYKSKIQVEQSAKGMHFHGGWMDDLMPKSDINIGTQPKSKSGS